MPDLHPLLTWLHTQMTALFATIGNVAANRTEPARQVVIYTVVTIALIWLIVKIVKKVSK